MERENLYQDALPGGAPCTCHDTLNSRAFLRVGIFLRASAECWVSNLGDDDASGLVIWAASARMRPHPVNIDQRIWPAEGLAADLITPCGSDDEGTVFDGAGAQPGHADGLGRSGG